MTSSVYKGNIMLTQPNRTLRPLKETHRSQRRGNFMNTFTCRDIDKKNDNRSIEVKADVTTSKSRDIRPIKNIRDKGKRSDLLESCNDADDTLRLPIIMESMGSVYPARTENSLLELRHRRPKEAYLERLNADNTDLRLIREDGYVYHCQGRQDKNAQSFPPIAAKTSYFTHNKTHSVMAPQHHGYVCSLGLIRKKLAFANRNDSFVGLSRAHTDYKLKAITYKKPSNRRIPNYEQEKLRRVDFNTHDTMLPLSDFRDGREASFVYPDRIVKTYTAVDGIIQNQISPRSILKKQEKQETPMKKFKRRGKRKSSINFGENMIREIVPSSRYSIDTTRSIDFETEEEKENQTFPSLARSRISLPRGRVRQGSEFQASQDFIRVMSQLEDESLCV